MYCCDLYEGFHPINVYKKTISYARQANSVPSGSESISSKLLVRHRVETRYGGKSIAIYQGDIIDMPCDQWILSAYQDDYIPSGPSPWKSLWNKYVKKPEDEYVEGIYGTPTEICGNDVVISLPTEELFNQPYPLIVLHFAGSEIYKRYNSDGILVLRKSYSELLLAMKILSERGQLAPKIGMTLLGSKLHGFNIEEALSAQKSFAEDALQTVAGLQELIICAYGDKAANGVLGAYHSIVMDNSTLPRDDIQNWISESLESISSKIIHQLDTLDDDIIKQGIRDIIVMTGRENVNLNDIAVQARSILESWLKSQIVKTNSKTSMESMIEEIVSKTGRPNRTGSYLHSLRIIGNTASHRLDAPYQLKQEDLVTIFLAILGILEINRDLNSKGEKSD
jgi:hypothetical protein